MGRQERQQRRQERQQGRYDRGGGTPRGRLKRLLPGRNYRTEPVVEPEPVVPELILPRAEPAPRPARTPAVEAAPPLLAERGIPDPWGIEAQREHNEKIQAQQNELNLQDVEEEPQPMTEEEVAELFPEPEA